MDKLGTRIGTFQISYSNRLTIAHFGPKGKDHPASSMAPASPGTAALAAPALFFKE
jgi:hypothetical protein